MATGVDTITEYIKNHPDKAMDIFKVLNNIAQSNPNSQVARDWSQAQQSALEPDSIGGMLDAETGGGKHGYEGWDDEGGAFESMYGKKLIPKEASFMINKVGLPVLGDVAKMVGGGIGAKKSILGSAMMAVAPNMFQRNDPFDRNGGSNLMAAGAQMAGAGESAKGAVAALIGNTIGNRLQQLGGDLEARDEKARIAQYQQAEKPTGKFWDEAGRVEKALGAAGKP